MSPQADFELIASKLRSISGDGGSIEAAQVKVIGLDEIREAAGPRWPRMRERVRNGSMSILSQHVGPGDVIVPAGDGFLILLAEGRPGDTQRRCQQMRDALLAFYLGEEALAALRPEVQNRTLTQDGLTDLLASSVRTHEGDERLVAKALGDEVVLAPVLVTHDSRAGALLAGPMTRTEAARRIAYNPDFILDGRHHTRRDFLELDLAVLDAALTRASRMQDSGRVAAIGVCVHSSTMQVRKSRDAYLHWLAGVDPALRRTLFVAISEIERGAPLISIAEWCSALRSLAPRVWLDFHYADHAIGSVGGSGAWAAGFHLPTFVGVQRDKGAPKLRAQIQFWSRSLHTQGMRLVVHGFQDAGFLECAKELGVDLLTSDAHWPFCVATDEHRAM